MKRSDNIEQLFKEKFEHFEADVNPKVWSHVHQSISSAPAGGVSSVGAKFAIGKIIAGAVAATAIAGSAWYFVASNNNNTNKPVEKKSTIEVASTNPTQSNISDTKVLTVPSNSTATQNQTHSFPPSLSANQIKNTHTSSQKIIDAKDETKAEESSNDNKSIAGSYTANTSSGSPSTASVNQTQTSQPKSQENKSSSNNQEAEHAPTATIFASTESGDAPLTVNFSNKGNNSTLNWDFGDGSASTEFSPSHTFNKSGTYVVSLSVKNSTGKSASDKITIEVKSISGITNIPNVFTPNGDGNNDDFFLGTKNMTSIEMTIQDMTDMHTVYKSADPEGKWDGKNLFGADAPSGRYWWRVTAVGIDGVPYEKFGIVELRR